MKINDLYERIEQIDKELEEEYKDGETCWAANLECEKERLETIICELEERGINEVKTIIVSNIQWDIYDEDYDCEDLPKVYYIDIGKHNVYLLEDVLGYAECLSDYISDKFGFCHSGFDVELCA